MIELGESKLQNIIILKVTALTFKT